LWLRATFTQAFQSHFAAFPEPREAFVAEGHDHFWFGQEWLPFTLIHDWLLAQGRRAAAGAWGGAEKGPDASRPPTKAAEAAGHL
jgi:hypothetical protein